MKSVLLIAGVLITALLIGQAVSGYFVIDDINITCPNDVKILYFYQPDCSHCVKMAPLIDSLIADGCNITKFDLDDINNAVIAYDYEIRYTPTIIVGDERLVGEFTAIQLQELINN